MVIWERAHSKDGRNGSRFESVPHHAENISIIILQYQFFFQICNKYNYLIQKTFTFPPVKNPFKVAITFEGSLLNFNHDWISS